MPLPGRACGECFACCVTLEIVSPEFEKPANVICANCTAPGCGIHETRPPACRDFYCAWRLSDALDDSWRPDRSGVILFSTPVEGYAAPTGLVLMLTEGEASIRRPYFAPFVAGMVAARRAIFMTVNGKRALLNPYLEPLLPQGAEAIRRQLLRFHAAAFGEAPTLEP